MGNKKFDGLDPLSILAFSPEPKFEAKNNDASNGMVKLVLQTSWEGNALLAYESALHVGAVDAGSIGIKRWVH